MDEETRDLLTEIRQDIKNLLPVVQMVDRHERLLYGNGHDGILTTVEKMKATGKANNRVFAGIMAAITAIGGDTLWRHLK
jgi:hypothetical protein